MIRFCLLALCLAACGSNVCDSYAGKTCIAVEVRGGAHQATVDELRFTSSAMGLVLDDVSTHEDQYAPRALPVFVAVVPAESFGGDFTLLVRGLVQGNEVGRGAATGTVVAGKHVDVTAILDHVGDVPGDLGVSDMATTDGAVSPDLTTGPPADSTCGSVADSWVQATKASGNCAGRVVSVVEGQLQGVDSISIARAPTGRVGIAYPLPTGGPDQIELHVSAFADSMPSKVTTKTYGGSNFGERQGVAAAIAADTDGTLYVCSLDASDGVQEIHFQTFDHTNAFSDPEVVAAGQGSSAYIAAAVDGSGRIVCAYHDRTDNSLRARARVQSVWQNELTIRSGTPSTLAGRGDVQMSVSGGVIQLGHHYAQSNTDAQPLYSSFDGTAWLMPKTVENNVDTSMDYGASVDVELFGTRRSLSYFAPNAGVYDLRVATFMSTADTPMYEVVSPAAATTLDYARSAMAVDAWGQLHIAVIEPSADNSSASLLYLRQYPDGSGGKKWLVDLVDAGAGPGLDTDAVDLVVDSTGRPHIAYYSGTTGKVMYATRTDR